MWKYPIIDLHATWLVINPIQGCPNRCQYCFLNGVNLTGKKPVELTSPEKAVKMLKTSRLYDEKIPLCIESQSDAFSTPSNIEYTKELVRELDKQEIKNPKIFITKCKIPLTFIKEIKKMQEKGHKFIFFLSYSGLDKDVEVGINKENIKNNFINLANNGIDIVHYWRPFIPQNSTEDKIIEVYNFVKKYAKCSIAIGLKVQKNIIKNMKFWNLLEENPNVVNAESIWDKRAYDYIYSENSKLTEKYPIYQSTSCALAYVLKESERNSLYHKQACLECNKCPSKQRKICKNFYDEPKEICKEEIISLLNRLSIKYSKDNLVVLINNQEKSITLKNVKLTMKDFTFLTQKTRYKIYAEKSDNDYYWNTSINNAKILLL